MSAGRGVVVTERHMAPETWEAIIDHTPVIYDLLWDAANKRPHDLWALIYDEPGAGDGNLLYPPLHLFKVDGDERGLILGGLGALWVLGANGIGPMIVDREYISDANKLSNGTFDEGLLYFRLPSEGSMWVAGGGVATNAGGLRTDDVLEYGLPFATRPGYAYQAISVDTFGIGTMRIRTIYTGRFNPPNLLANWLGVDALTIGPIAKPQLLNFAAGPSVLGSSMTFAGGILTAGPNEQPQYIVDPNFLLGDGGWSGVGPNIGDVEIVNEPSEGFGGWTIRAGPVTQHGLLLNADFGANLDNWYESSTDSTPDDVFYWFATDGVDGTGGATTAGTRTPVPLAITDRSEFDAWLKSHPPQWDFGFGQYNGTPYATFEANSLGDPNRRATGYMQDFDGSWILDSTSPTVVAMSVGNRGSFDAWIASQPNGTAYATFEANDLADPNRVAAGYIQDFDGSWVLANPRTKYLRADSSSGTGGVQAYDVFPGEQYDIVAQVRRSPDADGFAYISAHIPHPTVANREQWVTSAPAKSEELPGETFEPLRISNLNIPDNRFKLDLLFEVHEHTAEFWTVDNFFVTRVRGNRAQLNYDTPIPVDENGLYQFAIDMRSAGNQQVGNVRVGVILEGPGMEPKDFAVDKNSTDFTWNAEIIPVRVPTGYTTATPFVAAMDVIGDPFWLDLPTFLKIEGNTDISPFAAVTVVPDQRYLFQASAAVVGATRGTITVGIKLTGAGVDPEYITTKLDVKDTAGVNALKAEVRPAPGYDTATLYVESTDIEGGDFEVYSATLTKMDNNTATTVGTSIDVTPERTHKWSQIAMSGTALQRGTVTLAATCKRAGHDDIVFPSSAMQATEGARKVLEFTFTPPSGYDEIDVEVIGTDIEGDNWYLGAGELRDTDTGTVVFDTKWTNPAGAWPTVNSTAPDGAEEVRVAVVVEEGSTTWTIGAVALVRTGEPVATGDDIIAELLLDPVTGLPLGIAAGTINCPENIPNDWLITNMTARDALHHYCDVASDPPREFKLNPTIPPTIDVGTAADVFTVHDPADALLREDLDVQEMSDPESDIADRPTEVTVLGAELPTVSGRPVLITATAAVPGDARHDINNRAIVRTKHISSGTVDHAGYARALAEDDAVKEANPPVFLTTKLSGKATRADSPPGDTIYVFYPEAGVFDNDVTTTIEGQTVHPRGVRVLERQRVHGPSHHIEFLKPNGTRVQFRQQDGSYGPKLPGVRWSDEDATVLSVGDRLPSWKSDPQGKSEGEQYLRDRASRPR